MGLKYGDSKLLIFLICLMLIFPVTIVSANFTTLNEFKEKNEFFSIMDFKNNEANWTLLYYLAADIDHLSKETGPLIENLSKIGSSDSMNIVILRDNNKPGDTKLFYVEENGDLTILNEQFGWPDEVDTSDPNTLVVFTKQMVEAFPAKYYALIVFAAGGAGWQRFALFDGNGGSMGPIMPVFAEAMKEISNDGENKIDILVTPCITGMIEVAYELKNYVNYLSTTEEHTPDEALHYMRFYKAVIELKNDTGLKPAEFASFIPKKHSPVHFSFFKDRIITNILNKLPFPKLHSVRMHTTSSIVNLSHVSNLSLAVSELACFLIMHIKHDDTVRGAIKKARSGVREYGKAYSKYGCSYPILKHIKGIRNFLPLEINSFNSYVDLYHFADRLRNNTDNIEIKNRCIQVMEKLNESIVEEKSFPDDPSHGLSIYFPDEKFVYNRNIFGAKYAPSLYEDLKFSIETHWDEFLKAYLKI